MVRRTVNVLAAVAIGLTAAGAAPAQGHDHIATRPSSDHAHAIADAAAPARPLYSQDELLFLSHMIIHHEQALEMAALVPSRSDREAFERFARYIDGGQRAEIAQMQGLLDVAKARGVELPHHEMHGDPPMAGMLSKAQMAALSAAKGAEFERLWLEGMIYHHQGAIDMSLAQQQQQFESGRRPYGLDVLVDEILVTQRAEITKMQQWLREWGADSAAPARSR